jgi:hypothetical protein
MTTPIPQVNNVPYVNNAEFVKMTVYNDDNTTTVYTFSSSYKAETINSQVYTPLGGLMMVGMQQRDIRVTSFDTAITLTGVGADNIYMVLATRLKGSLVEVYRGFYDTEYVLEDAVLRFNGVITSYTITEDLDTDLRNDNFTVTVNCSAYKTILENRISGRQTSPNHWNEYIGAPGTFDTSMLNVPNLVDAFFDFGVPVTDQGKK